MEQVLYLTINCLIWRHRKFRKQRKNNRTFEKYELELVDFKGLEVNDYGGAIIY